MNTNTRDLFFEALKASLNNTAVHWESPLSIQEWGNLFKISSQHHVLPMIYEAVCRCAAFKEADKQACQIFTQIKRQVLMMVVLQARKTEEFYSLYQALFDAGIKPLVMKGLVCRSLYPNPDERLSTDEDILVWPDQFELAHEIMLKHDMQLMDPEIGTDHDHEVVYRSQDGVSVLEIHKTLIARKEDLYGSWNQWFFQNVFDRPVKLEINGKAIWTLSYTDHLLFLICHTMKHFLTIGVGIRQVCDICIFANSYGELIDWKHIVDSCKKMRAGTFAIALFKIGMNYLNFDPVKAHFPEHWKTMFDVVSEDALLADILDAGVYGKTSEERMRSGVMTVNAFSAQKVEKKNNTGLLRTIFPYKSLLENSARYVYLKDKPYLLPIAWISRIWFYRRSKVANVLSVGKQRVELLRKYDIID